jgi:hypothetical protein
MSLWLYSMSAQALVILPGLVDAVEWVDAVDFSQHMIELGKRLPNGNHPHLQWIYGKVEEVPLTPPMH